MTGETVPRPRPDTVGLRDVFAVEALKLRRLMRVRLALAACLLGPLLFVLGAQSAGTLPSDTLLGRSLLQSGFAAPLVVLGFAGQWVLPLLVAVVAGDVFASEDQHGTWSLLLSRSAARGQVFHAKVLVVSAYAVVVVLALALSSLLAGLLAVGHQDLVGLDGATLTAGAAATAVALSWLSVLPTTLAFVALAVLVSVLSRNGWVGVVVPVLAGLVMLLVSLLDLAVPVRLGLLTSGFASWHGLVRGSTYVGPVLWSFAVALGYAVVCLVVAHRVMTRRDGA